MGCAFLNQSKTQALLFLWLHHCQMASACPPFSPRLGKGHMEDHLLLLHGHLEGLTLFTFNWPKTASPHLIAGKDGRCRLVPHKSKCILVNSKCSHTASVEQSKSFLFFSLSLAFAVCMIKNLILFSWGCGH